MKREINLDGGEISILKAIGSSGQISGKLLVSKVGDLSESEFVNTLSGLISQDFVVSNRVNIRSLADAETSFFRINPSVAKDLRGAMKPGLRRDEDRGRRQRRG